MGGGVIPGTGEWPWLSAVVGSGGGRRQVVVGNGVWATVVVDGDQR